MSKRATSLPEFEEAPTTGLAFKQLLVVVQAACTVPISGSRSCMVDHMVDGMQDTRAGRTESLSPFVDHSCSHCIRFYPGQVLPPSLLQLHLPVYGRLPDLILGSLCVRFVYPNYGRSRLLHSYSEAHALHLSPSTCFTTTRRPQDCSV